MQPHIYPQIPTNVSVKYSWLKPSFCCHIYPFMVMFDLIDYILLYFPIFYNPIHYSRLMYVMVVNSLQSNDEAFRSWVLVYLDRDSQCPYLIPG